MVHFYAYIKVSLPFPGLGQGTAKRRNIRGRTYSAPATDMLGRPALSTTNRDPYVASMECLAENRSNLFSIFSFLYATAMSNFGDILTIFFSFSDGNLKLDAELFKEVKPGLSSYANEPDAVSML